MIVNVVIKGCSSWNEAIHVEEGVVELVVIWNPDFHFPDRMPLDGQSHGCGGILRCPQLKVPHFQLDSIAWSKVEKCVLSKGLVIAKPCINVPETIVETVSEVRAFRWGLAS